MQDNKNSSLCSGVNNANATVCIDTKRVLDCCKDRDCFEDARVYLTEAGEALLANATNVRSRGASILCAFVGVDEVPFNCGFYKVVVKYYIEVELEVCVAAGKSQLLKGLSVLEKDVILYGGEGRAISFSSNAISSYCNSCVDTASTNDPTAVVETVEPIILNTKVTDCNCTCQCTCTDYVDIPEAVYEIFGANIITNSEGAKIYASFGVFSVIRIVRPAQLLVSATDYSVPDKECKPATNGDNPCALFRTMAFPISQFRGTGCDDQPVINNKGNCGCGK